ncbi:MAG: Fimbrial assembly family protein [Mycobacterium sp.]|nr:Fimbrial assembly family protein [Mycobacterium sp.]
MSVDTLVVAVPRLPRVNLLPQEINEANKARQVKLGLVAVVVATALGMGYLTVTAGSSVGEAQDSYDAAQRKTQTLKVELSKHTGITALKAQVVERQNLLNAAMSQNVEWGAFLNDVRLGMPRGARLQTWNISLSPPATAATGATFGSGGVATWAFTGQAATYEDVAKLIESIYKIQAVDSVYATAVKKDTDVSSKKTVYTFSLQARVSSQALAPYNPKAGR